MGEGKKNRLKGYGVRVGVKTLGQKVMRYGRGGVEENWVKRSWELKKVGQTESGSMEYWSKCHGVNRKAGHWS